MAFYLVQFDQRSATAFPIDASSVDTAVIGLAYDEEIIEVPDDLTMLFTQRLAAYNASFGEDAGYVDETGDGKGYEGGGVPLPSGAGDLSMPQGLTQEAQGTPTRDAKRKRATKYDEWNFDALRDENGQWKRNVVNHLRGTWKLAQESKNYTNIFKAIRDVPGLTEGSYCCSGWSDHVEYNIYRLEREGA